MAEKPKSQRKSTMADITRPGKAAPSASSRPVIVGNKPTVQDPMVNEKKPEGLVEPIVSVKRRAPQVIAPLTDEEKEATENTDGTVAADEVTEQPAVEAPAASTESAAEESPPAGDDAASSGGNKDSGGKSSSIVDAVIDQASKNKDKKDDKKQAELEKRQAEIEKLIEEKKYFVPTSQATKKQRKTRWATLLLAMLLLAGAYLAIDAQVIKNDIQLPYEFFKESQNSNKENSPAATSNSGSGSSPKAAKQQPIEYVNEEFGFGFTIPAAWSALVDQEDEIVQEFENEDIASGKAYRIDVGIKMIGGFVTRDWTRKLPSTDIFSMPGFTDYQACPQGRAKITKTLYSDDNTCVVAQVIEAEFEGEITMVTVLIERKLSSPKTAGLQFYAGQLAIDDMSQTGLDAVLNKPEVSEYNQNLINFAKSIKDL